MVLSEVHRTACSKKNSTSIPLLFSTSLLAQTHYSPFASFQGLCSQEHWVWTCWGWVGGRPCFPEVLINQ